MWRWRRMGQLFSAVSSVHPPEWCAGSRVEPPCLLPISSQWSGERTGLRWPSWVWKQQIQESITVWLVAQRQEEESPWRVPAFIYQCSKNCFEIASLEHMIWCIQYITNHFYFPAVKKLKIIKHLEQVEVEEDGTAVFSCELNHESPSVQWLLNDRVLYTNYINKIQNAGKVYSLILKRLAPQESRVTFKTFDISESAFLRVRGVFSVTMQLGKAAFQLLYI